MFSPAGLSSEQPATNPSEEPAWKQRAIERSTKAAKLRAAQRVQRFLDAAQAIIVEKGSTDFTSKRSSTARASRSVASSCSSTASMSSFSPCSRTR